MSVESWKREFYPVDAAQVAKEDALAHSLKKWEGLTKENLDKHEVEVVWRRLVDQHGCDFRIDDTTCALCVHHYDWVGGCLSCPLSILRGGRMCDSGARNPYCRFLEGDPLPMLRLLRKAMKTMKDKE